MGKQQILCYCFKHTKEAIVDDIRQHGRSTIMESIIRLSKNGKCNCPVNNPMGK